MRLSVLYAARAPDWQSCKSISVNLRDCYSAAFPEGALQLIPVRQEVLSEDTLQGDPWAFETARSILEFGSEKLCLLELPQVALPLACALRLMSPLRFKKLEFVFHLYGDFTLFPSLWGEIGARLEGSPLRLFCASQRQCALVRSLESDPRQPSTRIFPFPVDCDGFRFSELERARWRRRLGISGSHLSVYTGRLSLQKGIIPALQLFERLVLQGCDMHFALVGAYDDFGGQTQGIQISPGYFFHRVREQLSAFPEAVRSRVHLPGALSRSALAGIYSAADTFVSLSLYHDEDFGMAPAEALSSGLPSLLTEWGGYASFCREPFPVKALPVHLDSQGHLSFSYALAESSWRGLVEGRHSPIRRLFAGKAFADQFSVEALAPRLREELVAPVGPFPGFSWRLQHSLSAPGAGKGAYRDLYRSYASSS